MEKQGKCDSCFFEYTWLGEVDLKEAKCPICKKALSMAIPGSSYRRLSINLRTGEASG